MRKLDIARQFDSDAAELAAVRERAAASHQAGNIRAAGNEVEEACRAYFRRILPDRYCVTSGHLIDFHGNVSSQQDIIIADTMRMSSLYTTRDGTEYIPAPSVFAVGEVKSSYRHAENCFGKYASTLDTINSLDRPLVENTHRFGEINDDTMISDLVRPISPHKYNNRLFSFLLCIDGGDFVFDRVKDQLRNVDRNVVPNFSTLLNKGVIVYANKNMEQTFDFAPYPDDRDPTTHDWCWIEGSPADGYSKAGIHLSVLYAALLDHLLRSELAYSGLYEYMGSTSYRRSSVKWAND